MIPVIRIDLTTLSAIYTVLYKTFLVRTILKKNLKNLHINCFVFVYKLLPNPPLEKRGGQPAWRQTGVGLFQV